VDLESHADVMVKLQELIQSLAFSVCPTAFSFSFFDVMKWSLGLSFFCFCFYIYFNFLNCNQIDPHLETLLHSSTDTELRFDPAEAGWKQAESKDGIDVYQRSFGDPRFRCFMSRYAEEKVGA